MLLALAAEHVTGTTFEAALRKEVLEPVGADRILNDTDPVHEMTPPAPEILALEASEMRHARQGPRA